MELPTEAPSVMFMFYSRFHLTARAAHVVPLPATTHGPIQSPAATDGDQVVRVAICAVLADASFSGDDPCRADRALVPQLAYAYFIRFSSRLDASVATNVAT